MSIVSSPPRVERRAVVPPVPASPSPGSAPPASPASPAPSVPLPPPTPSPPAILAAPLAVLGARDSGAATLAARLREATGERVVTALEESADAPPPALVLVAVDALCPIRPDDVEIAARLATRFPLAVVLTRAAMYGVGEGDAGHVGNAENTENGTDSAENTAETARRLAARGLPAPLVADSASSGAALVAEAVRRASVPEGVRAAMAGSSPVGPPPHRSARSFALPRAERIAAALGGAVRRPASRESVLDWLGRTRTEAISARTQAVRQHSHAARLAAGAVVSRRIRELSADARAEVAAAARRELPQLVERIDAAAGEVSENVLRNARAEAAYLRRRHLGSAGEREVEGTAPPLGLRFGSPPVHRGEEATLVFMGAAGGAGIGRLLAALLPGSVLALVCSIAAAVVGGLVLGALGVRARRTAALRAHLTALTAESFAALRAEIDHAVAEVLLHTESAITDAFAHDPGPRVRDIERRIHSLRTTGAPDSPN